MELGRLCAGCDLLCGRCGVGCYVGCCCGGDGGGGDHETVRSWSVSWCREISLDESPEDDGHKHWSGRTVLWEEVPGFVGSKVCLDGNARELHTDLLTRTSVWRSGDSPEFSMAPKEVAPEHCKNHNVAGFSLELERVDDGKGTKRQNGELECEIGGERDWNEEATMDGNGPWWNSGTGQVAAHFSLRRPA